MTLASFAPIVSTCVAESRTDFDNLDGHIVVFVANAVYNPLN